MEYIRVTKENLEEEHICCAISNNKDVQVSSKKAWLADRFDEGLVFLKSVERGKCFIEYIPAEHACVTEIRLNFLLFGKHFTIRILTVCNSRRLKMKLRLQLLLQKRNIH